MYAIYAIPRPGHPIDPALFPNGRPEAICTLEEDGYLHLHIGGTVLQHWSCELQACEMRDALQEMPLGESVTFEVYQLRPFHHTTRDDL